MHTYMKNFERSAVRKRYKFELDPIKFVGHHSKITVTVFFIRTNKFQKLILEIQNPESLKIHDGPGSRCPLVSDDLRKGIKINISSFQCVVFSVHHKPVKYFSVSVLQNIALKTSFNLSSKHFVESGSGANSLSFNFFVPRKYRYVAMDDVHIDFTGFRDENCLFGGLSVFEQPENIFQETVTYCHNFSRVSGYSFVSSTQNLLLVIYEYKQFSSIDFSLIIRSSECQGVFLNADKLPSKGYLRPYNSIILEYRPQAKKVLGIFIHYVPLIGQCSIIQSNKFLHLSPKKSTIQSVGRVRTEIKLILRGSILTELRNHRTSCQKLKQDLIHGANGPLDFNFYGNIESRSEVKSFISGELCSNFSAAYIPFKRSLVGSLDSTVLAVKAISSNFITFSLTFEEKVAFSQLKTHMFYFRPRVISGSHIILKVNFSSDLSTTSERIVDPQHSLHSISTPELSDKHLLNLQINSSKSSPEGVRFATLIHSMPYFVLTGTSFNGVFQTKRTLFHCPNQKTIHLALPLFKKCFLRTIKTPCQEMYGHLLVTHRPSITLETVPNNTLSVTYTWELIRTAQEKKKFEVLSNSNFESISWQVASKRCQAKNGSLPAVFDLEENKILAHFMFTFLWQNETVYPILGIHVGIIIKKVLVLFQIVLNLGAFPESKNIFSHPQENVHWLEQAPVGFQMWNTDGCSSIRLPEDFFGLQFMNYNTGPLNATLTESYSKITRQLQTAFSYVGSIHAGLIHYMLKLSGYCTLENDLNSYTFAGRSAFNSFSYSLKGLLEYLSAEPQTDNMCGMMVFQTYADPKWAKVDCENKLTQVVVCQFGSQSKHLNHQPKPPTLEFCPQDSFWSKGQCLTQVSDRSPFQANSTYDINALNKFLNCLENTSCYFDAKSLLAKVSRRKIIWSGQNMFPCTNSHVISIGRTCDGFPHCPLGEDEQNCPCVKDKISKNNNTLCWTLSIKPHNRPRKAPSQNASHTNKPCEHLSNLMCHPSENHCFSKFQVCIYKVGQKRRLQFCPNGAHLAKCAHFVCTRHFKCPAYYCIPWGYVCDGRWDCPIGNDELSDTCSTRNCHGMLKCQVDNSVCVHFADICDGENDCLHGDDETFCDLKQMCPQRCECFKYALSCSELISLPWHNIQAHVFLSVKNTDVQDCQDTLSFFEDVISLVLHNDSIRDVTITNEFVKLLLVDFSHNFISAIGKNSFRCCPITQDIILQNNSVQVIAKGSFHNTPHLSKLDLSMNKMQQIYEGTFDGLLVLDKLCLSHMPLDIIDSKTFLNIQMKEVITDNFRVCCVANAEICAVLPQWPFSCSSLISHSALQVLSWIISLLICFLNGVTIVVSWKMFTRQTKVGDRDVQSAYNLNTMCIQLSDILIGIHVLSLCVANSVFGDEYIGSDFSWRSGAVCHSLAFISFTANQLSQIYLNILAFSRYSLTKHPIESKIRDFTLVKKVFFTTSTLLIVFSVTLVALQAKENNGVQSLPTCIPFGNSDTILAYIITAFVGMTQMVSPAFIMIMYSLLVYHLVVHAGETSMKSHISPSMVGRLILISLTNIVCWLPGAVVMFITLATHQYPISLLLWVVMILTPVNSALNPIVLHSNFFCKCSCVKILTNDSDATHGGSLPST